MNLLQPPQGFKYKFVFSAQGPMRANITSSSKKSHDVCSPFSPRSSCYLTEPYVNVNIFSSEPILENLKRKRKKREWELNHVF
jgi:hypothetical protein